jgi:F-type H+-transporting ATPase subunit c
MKGNFVKAFSVFVMALLAAPSAVFAEGTAAASTGSAGLIAIAAGLSIGMAALGGTLSQGKVVSAGLDSIGRNPAAQGKLFIPLLIGLAFVESLVIIAFVIATQLVGNL